MNASSRVKRLQWRKHPHTAAELRRAALRATIISPNCMPSWAVDALIPFYVEALRLTRETGVAHEVDHYYPLLGKTVCGLHVPGNVRVVTRGENMSKGNRLPDDPETWPPFEYERPARKARQRPPTNPPYREMFPNSLVRPRRGVA
jgi:hypothetical protein